MGSTWEVSIWGQWWLGTGAFSADQWSYKTVYAGESLIGALLAFWRHRNVAGCIKLEYRP